jgi:hypothetical protein
VLIKKIGYGSLKLQPSVLWELSARELVDMFEASIEIVDEDLDREYQRTSWFTSLLMNATGNFKKKIQPDKLYIPLAKQKTQTVEYQKEYVDSQREELKKKFNIE